MSIEFHKETPERESFFRTNYSLNEEFFRTFSHPDFPNANWADLRFYLKHEKELLHYLDQTYRDPLLNTLKNKPKGFGKKE